MDATLGYLTALGLSTAAGLNAWIPLLAVGLLSRFTDLLALDRPWDVLENPLVLGALGVVALADFVGDKVPAVDHALHVAGLVIAPVTGVVASLAATGTLDVSAAIVVTISIVAAELTQGARTAARPVSTALTGGAGNPVVSLGEDGVSGLLSFAAIAVPVVAFVLVLVLGLAAWLAIRRVRRSRRGTVG
ncbi:MAG TPA: DUF4126 domain-containing protein [Actinomycetota bacterium]